MNLVLVLMKKTLATFKKDSTFQKGIMRDSEFYYKAQKIGCIDELI